MTEGSNNDIKDDVENDSSNDNAATEKQNVTASEGESQEVKKLEEKEHYELDYFSKEELIKKNELLEKDLVKIKEDIKKLKEENEKSKNKYMHLQAEFENAQKRWDKNRQNLRIEYTASVLKNLLPLYDSFKKALDSDNETETHILQGFYKQFMNILKSYGVELIEVKINDSFDYSMHEALSTVEKEDIPENTILDVVQDGFKYGKEVLRYANVIISRKPKPPEPEPEEKEVEAEQSEEQEIKEEISKDKETIEKKLKDKKHRKDKKEKEHKNS